MNVIAGRLSGWSLVFLATVAGAAAAQEPDKIIDLGSGRYQFVLRPEIGTSPPAWSGGAVEWEYVGQAVYHRASESNQRKRDSMEIPAVRDLEVTSTLERMMRSTMEDEHGRLFRVKKVDQRRLQDAIDRYNANVEADFGYSPEELDPEFFDATDPDWTGPGKAMPLGWNRDDQDGDGDDDRFRWNSDGRTIVAYPLTTRQEKTIVYFFGDDDIDAGSCSGVLIGDEWVLTAAHCVLTDSGSWIYAEGSGESYRGKVCTEGNFYAGAECANVTARWTNGSYGGDGDWGDDLSLLRIDQPLGDGNYMALSQASNSTIKSYSNYNLGYPGTTPGGSTNLYGSSCAFSRGDPFGGMWDDADAPCQMVMYWDADEVNHTSTKKIGTKIDVSTGHSGGPIYYFPGGGGHFLTGIMSGHHHGATKSWNGGPKIPYHRDWIIGMMD